MTKDEALKFAMEALEDIGDEWGFTSQRTVPKRKEAITAIKEALAQPEQPKVRTGDCLLVGVCASEGHKIQPQRTWVGLTNDEVNNLAAGCHLGNSVQDAIYKAQAKLKEKNTNSAVYGTTQLEKPEAINAGIERTSRLRKAMDKEHEYMNHREAFPKREYVMPVDRNEVLEEVAKAVYNFKAFEKDTMDSFVAYIRSMKR